MSESLVPNFPQHTPEQNAAWREILEGAYRSERNNELALYMRDHPETPIEQAYTVCFGVRK